MTDEKEALQLAKLIHEIYRVQERARGNTAKPWKAIPATAKERYQGLALELLKTYQRKAKGTAT